MNDISQNTELLTAIADIQQNIGTLPKTKRGYNYSYTDLPSLMGVLNIMFNKHNLVLVNTVKDNILTTTLIHIPSKQSISSSVQLDYYSNEFAAMLRKTEITLQTLLVSNKIDITNNKKLESIMKLNKINMTEIQFLGSSMTYIKRYNIINILSLTTDDDSDGAMEFARQQESRIEQRQQENEYINEQKLQQTMKSKRKNIRSKLLDTCIEIAKLTLDYSKIDTEKKLEKEAANIAKNMIMELESNNHISVSVSTAFTLEDIEFIDNYIDSLDMSVYKKDTQDDAIDESKLQELIDKKEKLLGRKMNDSQKSKYIEKLKSEGKI